MRRLAPALFLTALACGPGAPSGDDEIGGSESETSSEAGTTETGSDSGTSETDSTTETSSDSGSTTETGSDSDITTETGDPPELCPLEADDPGGLWTLPCGPGCSQLDWFDGLEFQLEAEGSQLPTDNLACGAYSFEGTVIDHPSPDTWVIDACPCDADCAELDPHTIDFAKDIEHPAPELLPDDLGSCVRADVFRDDVHYIEPICGPTAVALWSLDEGEPRLIYAQGNDPGTLEPNIGIELGPLTVEGAGQDCSAGDGNPYWYEHSLRFNLDGAEIVVPHQALDILVHASGEYEARNVANIRYLSEVNSAGPSACMWALRSL